MCLTLHPRSALPSGQGLARLRTPASRSWAASVRSGPGQRTAVSIGTDQWFGSQADPDSVRASTAMTPAFLAWAAIGAVPVVRALRPRRPETADSTPTMEGI